MQPKSTGSWIQLGIFTAFLFLLVAIPYTIYLKSTTNKASVTITNLPSPTVEKKNPTITPPSSSASTTCVAAPANYQPDTTASEAGYLVKVITQEVCFAATLPPFPFTWQTTKDFVNGLSIDVPSNWTEKATKKDGITFHGFFAEPPTTATAAADISYAISQEDPYASETAFLKQPLTKANKSGNIYTNGPTFIAAVLPTANGFFILQASTVDAAFYAFQHMLNSLTFTK